jgi:hypothetical protein
MERKHVRYQAATAEGAQWKYATDSARAAAEGWMVESVGWEAASPPMLGATYLYSGVALPVQVPALAARPSHGRLTALAAVLIAAGVIVAAYLVTS